MRDRACRSKASHWKASSPPGRTPSIQGLPSALKAASRAAVWFQEQRSPQGRLCFVPATPTLWKLARPKGVLANWHASRKRAGRALGFGTTHSFCSGLGYLLCKARDRLLERGVSSVENSL